MKSIIPSFLLLIFVITASCDTLIHISKLFGMEELVVLSDNNSDESKNENETQENFKDLYFSHITRLGINNSYDLISRFEFRNKVIFLSHQYVEDIYSPPDFV